MLSYQYYYPWNTCTWSVLCRYNLFTVFTIYKLTNFFKTCDNNYFSPSDVSLHSIGGPNMVSYHLDRSIVGNTIMWLKTIVPRNVVEINSPFHETVRVQLISQFNRLASVDFIDRLSYAGGWLSYFFIILLSFLYKKLLKTTHVVSISYFSHFDLK